MSYWCYWFNVIIYCCYCFLFLVCYLSCNIMNDDVDLLNGIIWNSYDFYWEFVWYEIVRLILLIKNLYLVLFVVNLV